MPEPKLLLSCEHAGNSVPRRWAHLFSSARARALLRTHRGWDIGALALARELSRSLGAPLVTCTTTRLLADANRPRGNRNLFSRFTRELPAEERRAILRRAHEPHWRAVEEHVRRALARRRRVLHLSIHSFTPVLAGETRNCELGLLYDPRRPLERAFCRSLQERLLSSAPELRVRRNYPYHGAAAALTTSLRRMFPAQAYLGIEIELNQGWWTSAAARDRRGLVGSVAAAIRSG
jgi:predicted N-formylglutamate amidohydrolase